MGMWTQLSLRIALFTTVMSDHQSGIFELSSLWEGALPPDKCLQEFPSKPGSSNQKNAYTGRVIVL